MRELFPVPGHPCFLLILIMADSQATNNCIIPKENLSNYNFINPKENLSNSNLINPTENTSNLSNDTISIAYLNIRGQTGLDISKQVQIEKRSRYQY